MRIVRGLTGLWRHWEAGRRRRRRICIRTTRFSVEPRRASPTIGIRIQFTWNLSRAAPTLALNAREPTPMRRRRPLRAAKNVQMLWRSAKKKLDQATTPRTCTASFGISWGQYIVSCYALDCGTRHPRCKQAYCALRKKSPESPQTHAEAKRIALFLVHYRLGTHFLKVLKRAIFPGALSPLRLPKHSGSLRTAQTDR